MWKMWNWFSKAKTAEEPVKQESDIEAKAAPLSKSFDEKDGRLLRISPKKPVGDKMPEPDGADKVENAPELPWDWDDSDSKVKFNPAASLEQFKTEALALGASEAEAGNAASEAVRNMIRQFMAAGAYDPVTGELDIAKQYGSRKFAARVKLLDTNERIISRPYCPDNYDAKVVADSIAYMTGCARLSDYRPISVLGPVWVFVARQFAAACKIFDMTGRWPAGVPYFDKSDLREFMEQHGISPTEALANRQEIILQIAETSFKTLCCDCGKDMAESYDITASIASDGSEEYRCPECAARLLDNYITPDER